MGSRNTVVATGTIRIGALLASSSLINVVFSVFVIGMHLDGICVRYEKEKKWFLQITNHDFECNLQEEQIVPAQGTIEEGLKEFTDGQEPDSWAESLTDLGED